MKTSGEAKAMALQHGKHHAIKVTHHDPISVPHSPEELARLKTRRRRAVAWRLLLVFVVISVTLAILLHVLRKADIAESRAFARRTACLESIAAGCAGVQTVAKSVKPLGGEAQTLLETTTEIVVAVLGHGLKDTGRLVTAPAGPPRPAAGVQKAETTPTASAKADGTGKPKSAVAEPEVKEDVPYGMPTREELERRRRRAQKALPPADSTAVTNPAPAPPVSQPPPLPAGEPSAVPPQSRSADVENAAMKVVDHVAAFSNHVSDIMLLARDAATTKNEMERIVGEALLAEADRKIRDCLAAAQQERSGATQELAAAAASLQVLKAIRDRFELEKREAERKEEARRKEAEHQRHVEGESAMAAQAAESAKALFKTMQFTQAVEQLTGKLAEFRTEEGRQALKKVIDRYAYLANLKAFLIEQINRRPFEWGWGRGNTVRDVLGADENVVKLRNGQAAWADVNPQQMARFVERYTPKEVPFRPRGKARLGAAIYFQEMGLPEEATSHANKAVADDRDLKEEVARLLKP